MLLINHLFTTRGTLYSVIIQQLARYNAESSKMKWWSCKNETCQRYNKSETWKMSWLKLMFSTSWLVTVLNLAQSVLTYQTSVSVIGFLVMVKGSVCVCVGGWGWHLDEIPSNLYTLQLWKRGRELIGWDALTALSLLHSSCDSHVPTCPHPPGMQLHLFFSFFSSRPLQFRGSMLLHIKM